jgi:hypothetical protein
MSSMTKPFVFAIVTVSACAPAIAEQFTYEELNISMSTADDWTTLPVTGLAIINQTCVTTTIMHANRRGIKLNADEAGSQVLLLQSKLPIGSNADNPNFLLAIEKTWSDKFDRTGKGYLDLMADRVKKLAVPTRFISEPRELKIGENVFYYADAENTKVLNAKTKQRYICGFVNGHYLYFVLSYNDENDDYFSQMMACVNTLTVGR